MTTIRRLEPGINRRRFFPSARCVLMVRLDPGTVDDYKAADVRVETSPPKTQAPSSPLVLQTSAATGAKAFSRTDFRAAFDAARVNVADAIARLPRGDGLTRIIDVVPMRSQRRVNTYRRADELELTLDWKAVPFDARVVRSVLVLHYEGCMTADEFGSSSRQGLRAVPASGNNLRFVGLVDEVSDQHGEDGDVLTLHARDLTAVLLDAKWPADLDVKIPAGATIVEAVQAVLATNPAFEILRGPFLRTDGAPPNLDPSLYPRIAVTARERHRQDKVGAKAAGFVLRRPPKGGGDSSYWDVLTDLCVSHGLRPSVEADRLVLLEPRNLYRARPGASAVPPGTPVFPTSHREAIGDLFPVRRMVFGSNVSQLRFQRKLGRIRAPSVEVTSRNPDAKRAADRFLKVRWPPVGHGSRATANSVDPTGNKPEDKIHPVQLRGIVDEKMLLSIARQVYEGMGRQELGVAIDTDDPASFSDHPDFDPNLDPDLLAIRAGDPVRLLVSPASAAASRLYTFSELQGLAARAAGSPSKLGNAAAFLVDQGWSAADARQLVKVLSSASLPSEFRVVNAAVSFDAEGGFSIQLDCRDYVAARADPDDVAQSRTTAGKVRGAPARATARPTAPNAPSAGTSRPGNGPTHSSNVPRRG